MFIVYPAAIARMPASPFWAILFFVFLFSVGVDSQVKEASVNDTVHLNLNIFLYFGTVVLRC